MGVVAVTLTERAGSGGFGVGDLRLLLLCKEVASLLLVFMILAAAGSGADV
jgi:hypothetical protein